MMEQINRDNYEAYFLDYVEGNLSDEQIQELNAFLRKYPDLKAELDSFESITLEEAPIKTDDSLKASLKREESTGLLEQDYLMIAQIENTITSEEKTKLSSLVKETPELLDDLALYHKTVLPQDTSIEFPNKSILLQKERRVIYWWQYASAAAVLLFAIFNWDFTENTYNPRSVSFSQIPAQEEQATAYAFVLSEESPEVEVQSQLSKDPIVKKENKNFASVLPKALEETVSPLVEESSSQESIAQLNTPIKVDESRPTVKEENTNPTVPTNEETFPQQEEIAENNDNDFIPIEEYIKSKTFSETVLEELADRARNTLNLEVETEKNEAGETQKLALNIGKFSFSRIR